MNKAEWQAKRPVPDSGPEEFTEGSVAGTDCMANRRRGLQCERPETQTLARPT